MVLLAQRGHQQVALCFVHCDLAFDYAGSGNCRADRSSSSHTGYAAWLPSRSSTLDDEQSPG